jgi:uncharacterized protein
MGNSGKIASFAGLVLVASPVWAACSADVVELQGTGGKARFTVEVADDADTRATGLMNRPKMATGAGMLFVYASPKHASFWMENTLIPLDMIFADATGTVTRVHENAQPMDRTSIDGGEGVQFVLEINGGLAGRMGIAPGTVLRHPAVAAATAAWSCSE